MTAAQAAAMTRWYSGETVVQSANVCGDVFRVYFDNVAVNEGTGSSSLASDITTLQWCAPGTGTRSPADAQQARDLGGVVVAAVVHAADLAVLGRARREALHQDGSRRGFPGVDLDTLTYDIADMLGRFGYPIDAAQRPADPSGDAPRSPGPLHRP
jgi:hypothetical protein